MPSDRMHRILIVTGILLLLPLVPACQRTMVEQTMLERHPSELDDFAFWDALAEEPVVSNDDALHALILMQDGRDPSADFEARAALAGQKGWLEGTTRPLQPNESASVGLLSVAGCRILDIRGGLTMQLFGDSPRYCTRELNSMGILPGLTPNEAMTGLEFITFIDSLEERDRLQRAWQRQDQSNTTTAGDTQ
tara:strand:+ start:6295 stop:6873 length:579 start_codon:yes stop_codon:yes gene_type:complete